MADTARDHLQGLTVAVTGASGNVGTALLRRLTAAGAGVAGVRGLARRRPPDVAPWSGVRWHLTDLGEPASGAGSRWRAPAGWPRPPAGRASRTSSTCPRWVPTPPDRATRWSARTGRS